MSSEPGRNRLSELNRIMFEMLERLNDKSVTGEVLLEEIERAKAMGTVATQIVGNCALQLKIRAMQYEYSTGKVALPQVLED